MFGRTKKAVDVHTANDMATKGEWVIVDVRTKREHRAGSARGSVHYSLESLPQRVPILKDKKVLAICRSGSRSRTAARLLERNGIEAMNVKGGMIAWNRADLPVRKGK